MPTRDDQDFENRRQQIIDGALDVFSNKGFEKATNKDIAEAAKIGSPGLIYHYFKDKHDLFQQVIEQRIPALQLLARGDEMMDRPPREVLTLFASTYTKMVENRTTVALMKLMLGEAIRRPIVAEMMNTIGPGRGLTFLSRYIEHQMAKGVFRRTDAGAAARCFVGPLLSYVMTREIFPQPDSRNLAPETMVETAVDIFLRGMQPDAPQPE